MNVTMESFLKDEGDSGQGKSRRECNRLLSKPLTTRELLKRGASAKLKGRGDTRRGIIIFCSLFIFRFNFIDGDHGDHLSSSWRQWERASRPLQRKRVSGKDTEGNDDRKAKGRETKEREKGKGETKAGRTDAANLHAGARKGAEGGLATRAGGLALVATSAADLDVQRSDADLLAALSDVLRGKHRRVGRGLVTISLDLHAT